MIDNNNAYEPKYGITIAMIKSIICDGDESYNNKIIAGARIWKASRLPIRYIAEKIDVNFKDLASHIDALIASWHKSGIVTPVVDVIGDIFEKYYPECSCIRYTHEQLKGMSIFNEQWLKDFDALSANTLSKRDNFPKFKTNNKFKERRDPIDSYSAGLISAEVKKNNVHCKFNYFESPPSRYPDLKVGNII